MKRFKLFVLNAWKPTTFAVMGCVTIAVVLLYKLGSLVGGIDSKEAVFRATLVSGHTSIIDLLRNGVDFPYRLGLFLLQLLPFDGAGAVRLWGVVIAFGAAISLYIVLRQWHTSRLAIMGTALFVGSSWLLHTGRYASTEVLFLLPLGLLAAWTWYQAHPRSRFAFLVLSVAASFCLYVPGALLAVIPVVIWQRKRIARALRGYSTGVATGALVACVILITPLLGSLIWPADNTTSLAVFKHLLGIPNHWPTIVHFFQNIADIPMQLFIRGTDTPARSIPGVPLIDVFTAGMTITGLYVYARDWHLDRCRLLLGVVLIDVLLIGLGGSVTTTALLPLVYLFAAEGVGYMLIEWLRVFPRNPVARGVGIGILSAAICMTVGYQFVNYFKAWPHNSEVQSAFRVKTP